LPYKRYNVLFADHRIIISNCSRQVMRAGK
jgi:hypothetical protein